MATSTTKTKPAPAPAPAADAIKAASAQPVAAPAAHPPMSAYANAWVYRPKVALAGNRTGFVWVLKADLATMIAAGDAVDPYTTPYLPAITNTPAPAPAPAPGPAPAPTSIAILSFSAESPTRCTVSAADAAKLANGATVTATAFSSPHEDLNGSSGTVANLTTQDFQLQGVDMTAVDVGGVTATATVS